MMEQHPRSRIDIRIRILRLAVLQQHARRNLRVPLHEPKQRITRNLRPRGREVNESLEPRVWLPQHRVAVAGDHLPGIEGRPEIVLDGLVGEVCADVRLHFEDPAEDFLGCQAVEGAGETLQAGGVAEEGVAEGGADEVGGVGGDVAAFVVAVQGEVES